MWNRLPVVVKGSFVSNPIAQVRLWVSEHGYPIPRSDSQYRRAPVAANRGPPFFYPQYFPNPRFRCPSSPWWAKCPWIGASPLSCAGRGLRGLAWQHPAAFSLPRPASRSLPRRQILAIIRRQPASEQERAGSLASHAILKKSGRWDRNCRFWMGRTPGKLAARRGSGSAHPTRYHQTQSSRHS